MTERFAICKLFSTFSMRIFEYHPRGGGGALKFTQFTWLNGILDEARKNQNRFT